jgi:hypothetical protein
MKSKLYFAVFVCLGLLISNLASSAAQQQLIVGNYKLISSQRVTLYQYDYAYTADLTNTGPAVNDVQATLTSLDAHTLVIDGSLSFANVAANSQKTSLDTFTIRQDRRYAYDPSKLSWAISFSPVTENTPPVANAGPDQTAYTKDTVQLNGSESTDVDGDALTYAWTLVSWPVGSTAALINPKTVNPTLWSTSLEIMRFSSL